MLTTLLYKISNIQSKYNSIAAITGENFNIFNLTGVARSEVKLHSSLIAELLNPEGKHGLKSAFLNYFLEALKELKCTEIQDDILEKFKDKDVSVFKEEWLGYIDSDYTTGGYIDIIIKTGNDAIIIENKIDAGDQKKQLRRYYDRYNTALILYLTLDGRSATDYTTFNSVSADKLIHPICISYGDLILKWMEKCRKEAVNFPIVRETLTQYIYLIKQLTNQTTNDNMKNEIAEAIVANEDFIRSVDEIWKNTKAIKLVIINETFKQIEVIAKEKGWKLESDANIGKKESEFVFYLDNTLYHISYYFVNDFERIEVGLEWNDNKLQDDSLKDKLRKHFIKPNTTFNIEEHNGWIVWRDFKEWEETPWAELQRTFPKKVIEETQRLKDILSTFTEEAFNIVQL